MTEVKQKKSVGALLFTIVSVSALAAIGVYLFFGEQIMFKLGLTSLEQFKYSAAREDSEILKIGYIFQPSNFEPTHFDQITRSHLVDIYEGLVRTDGDLNIEPSLAVSWGLIDNLTWEFNLRKNVVFHNGKSLSSNDVLASLERARKNDISEIKDLLNTIESVESVDGGKIRITTNVPDPLLLNKLAVTMIFPKDYGDFEKPMGTGPYKFVSKEGGVTKFVRNASYWGIKPAFNNVELHSISGRNERIKALEDGELDILGNLPPTVGCSFKEAYKNLSECKSLKNKNIVVKSIPSLEVSFLLFNMESEFFNTAEGRSIMARMFDTKVFIDLAFGYARSSSQFVSNGVFGFNPKLQNNIYDLDTAKKNFNNLTGGSFERINLVFDYPDTLTPIGAYVQDQFYDLGVDVTLNPLSEVDLQKKILAGESDFYFLGWRSELGDSIDFLQAVAHSKDMAKGYGLYNGINYSNREVDKLIEDAQKTLETETRLGLLQDAMKIIVEDDVIGVPLFESETIFAYENDIFFNPRVDGYIYASEIY